MLTDNKGQGRLGRQTDNRAEIEIRLYSDVFLFNKRTERLVAAIYMVTDILPAGDSLKVAIRQHAIELLTFTLSSENGSQNALQDPSIFSGKFASRVLAVLSFIEVAKISGSVSDMNHALLTQEMSDLVIAAQNLSAVGIKDALAPERMARVPQRGSYGSILSVSLRGREGESKGHHKGHGGDIKRTRGVSGGASTRNRAGLSRTQVNDYRADRRGKIMELLKDGAKLSIRDFLVSIKDVGEKTMQRDLTALVKENVLKKEGEKRWSRYSLSA